MTNLSVGHFMTILPQTVGEGATLDKAKELMQATECHHLPVLQGGQLVGVISSNDLNLMLLTSKSTTAKVKDIMSLEPKVVQPELSVKKVATMMLEEKIGSVIVQGKDTQPWGIFTTTDALKVVAHLA